MPPDAGVGAFGNKPGKLAAISSNRGAGIGFRHGFLLSENKKPKSLRAWALWNCFLKKNICRCGESMRVRG